ncbi:MerR family transcriptional regulator [Nocardioides coralli]|uniref:MerR family transcriptional regulator n=1 Tax=Nocardioides coralli TaxID=2872154 RepID=UPI001CA3D941|nr:MerR family transcriptional regulator [Nocardioides coralli]QZY28526.1 MerR family transcriptional regulator [Nocardioides coralli]
MITVKRAAERVGISPDTLRAWERRYGVVAPARSEGGYRLYDEAAIRRLALMKALVDAGWSPAQAARRAKTARADPPPEREPAADVDSLVLAGRDLDEQALNRTLDLGFAAGSFEQIVDGWLMPSLRALGGAWEDGWVGVAGEHFVSAGVHRRLAALFDATGYAETTAPVAVGLASGCRHELGVLAFAVALRRAGVTVVYLGADVPQDSWLDAVRSRSAVSVVMAVPTTDDLPTTRGAVDVLRREAASVPVFVGGAQQDAVGFGADPLGHRIARAARVLAGSLPDGRSAPPAATAPSAP